MQAKKGTTKLSVGHGEYMFSYTKGSILDKVRTLLVRQGGWGGDFPVDMKEVKK